MLPKDIDPQSFSRLPVLTRDDMKDEDSKRIYDMLAGGEGKTVGATGPAAISLYSPKVAEAIQMLNQYLRFHGVLKSRDFEVAILVVAREFDQQYEWSGHEMGARAAKVPEPVIEAIKFNKDAAGFSDGFGQRHAAHHLCPPTAAPAQARFRRLCEGCRDLWQAGNAGTCHHHRRLRDGGDDVERDRSAFAAGPSAVAAAEVGDLLARRVNERNGFSPAAPVDTKIIQVRCNDRMPGIQLAQANEA